MTDTENGWLWFSGRDDENFPGTHNTRDQAIAELDGFGGYIVEARQDPLRLADCIDASLIMEGAEDDAEQYSNEYGDPIFVCAADQLDDLQARLKIACDEWQSAHGLVFTPYAFTATRNHENIAPDAEVKP
jgi:hypothetical protein